MSYFHLRSPPESPRKKRAREDKATYRAILEDMNKNFDKENEQESGIAHALGQRYQDIDDGLELIGPGQRQERACKASQPSTPSPHLMFRHLAKDCIEGLKTMENHNRLLQVNMELLRQERDTAKKRAAFETKCGDEKEEEKYEVQRYWARTQLALNRMTLERDDLKKTVAEQSSEIERCKQTTTTTSPSKTDIIGVVCQENDS